MKVWGCFSRGSYFECVLIAYITVILLLAFPVAAQQEAFEQYCDDSGYIEFLDDNIIIRAETIICANGSAELEGLLILDNAATLIFQNFSLSINAEENDVNSGIVLQRYSEFHVLNGSKINSTGRIENGRYIFTVGFLYTENPSFLEIRDSNISHIGFNSGDPQSHGLLIGLGSRAVIDNASFTNNYNGLYLYQSNNSVIINSTFSDNEVYGVFLSNSNNNNITGNTAENNNIGFSITAGDYNILKNNTALNNTAAGFGTGGADNNVYAYNYASYNYIGFKLGAGSDYNTITNNIAYNNSGYGYSLEQADYNTLTSNNASTSRFGFFLFNSPYTTLTNNTASNNSLDGFYIDERSDAINLTYNTAYNNTQYGFFFEGENDNPVENCIATGNNASGNEYGFFLEYADNNNLTGNTAFNNSDHGFYLYQSSYNNLTTNNAYNNSDYGFYLEGSVSDPVEGNTLTANNATDNQIGFNLEYADNNRFTDNNASQNTNGFHLESSDNNVFSSTYIYGGPSTSSGFYLDSSVNNTFLGGSIDNMGGNGFHILGGSDNPTVRNYNISSCQKSVRIAGSENASFIDSVLEHDTGSFDAYLETGAYNTLFLNTTHDNDSINIPNLFEPYSDGNLTVQWYLDVEVNNPMG
ncbi:MAG: right-handed parallel beta-helix repeat-containing protein, partial [Candidatus Altiarchaeota archaeon]